LLEANRLGCDVIGYDINPMAYWIVHKRSLPLIFTPTAKPLTSLCPGLKMRWVHSTEHNACTVVHRR